MEIVVVERKKYHELHHSTVTKWFGKGVFPAENFYFPRDIDIAKILLELKERHR
jgi:hypothetical protein